VVRFTPFAHPQLSLHSLSRDECKKKKSERKARRKRETKSNSHRPTAAVVRILFARGKRNTEFRWAEAYRAGSQKCRINVIIANYTRADASLTFTGKMMSQFPIAIVTIAYLDRQTFRTL
jgi:hypothetical protein